MLAKLLGFYCVLYSLYILLPGFSVVGGNEARYSKAFWISGGIGGGVGRWAPEKI